MEVTKGCPKCGRTLSEDISVCPYCGYKFDKLKSYYTKMEKEKFDKNGEYAGLLKRIIAINVDIVFIFLITLMATLIHVKFSSPYPYYYYQILFVLLFVFYKIFSETVFSKTVGKKIVGIKIVKVNDKNEKISLLQSILSNFLIILDFLTLGIGIVMALFNSKKMMLHDILSKTLVINEEEKPENECYAPSVIRLLAFAIDLALVYGLVYLAELGFDYVSQNYIISTSLMLNFSLIEKVIYVVLVFAYFVCSESGSSAGSLGKKILGIRIENINGHRMGAGEAFIRTICLFFEIVTLGFLLCLVDNKNQTLKDKIVNTKVIRI